MKEIWLEEATDFTEQDFKQLRIRLSRNRFSENVKMILSFNPIGDTHWLIKFLDVAKNRPDLYLLHHSTYKDNIINLSQSFIDDLEAFIDLDENFYRIYTLGLPGVLRVAFIPISQLKIQRNGLGLIFGNPYIVMVWTLDLIIRCLYVRYGIMKTNFI